MPCSSNGQDEWTNERDYGLYISSEDLAARVACELSKVIFGHEMQHLLSDLALKWIAKHYKEDEHKEHTGD